MQNTDLLSNDLTVTTISRGYLSETAKWAKFLAILGFIMCGFIVIAAFFLPFLMSFIPSGEMMPMGVMGKGLGIIMAFMYLGLALIFFMPCLYLYRFSTKMKTALLQSDSEVLDTSLSNMKSFFKFYGIMTIITMSFYVLILIITILGASIFNSNF